MNESVDDLARTLLDYMKMNTPVEKSDVLIGMGALDIRIAERTAQLFLDGYGKYIIFTGGLGKITKHTHTQTEAERFRDTAIKMDVPEDKILLEKEATNSGENIVLVQELLESKDLHPKSLLVVTKSYMERRIYAAYKKQWKDKAARIIVTSPQITYEEHFNEDIPKDLFINVMVGDLQRIKVYPKQGFQIEQNIPENVWEAYKKLVRLGYTDFVIKNT
ncbi:MAG TPA: YdcF family protein [Candidatus Saccharimonadales bacterium]|nr:YdcF family protein [Candidatus Saccharimonadales bacterium]